MKFYKVQNLENIKRGAASTWAPEIGKKFALCAKYVRLLPKSNRSAKNDMLLLVVMKNIFSAPSADNTIWPGLSMAEKKWRILCTRLASMLLRLSKSSRTGLYYVINQPAEVA